MMYPQPRTEIRSSLFVTLICLLIHGPVAETANILVSGVFGDGSHYHSMVAIGKSLVARGHNVTILIADAYSERASNPEYSKLFIFEKFHHPELKETSDNILNLVGELPFSSESTMTKMWMLLDMLSSVNTGTCESVLRDNALLGRLLEFDAFVVDVVWTCGIYVQSYLTRHMGAKNMSAMVFAPMTPLPYIFQQAGSPFITSYQPAPMSELTSSMSFFQRIKNTILYFFVSFMSDKKTLSGPFIELVDKYDLDPLLKSTISNHVDLYLINVDFSVEFPFSLMPNVIPVGGVTTRPAEPLEADLEQFMRSSGEDGVVLFSLGSYFASITKTRPDIIKMFIDAFSRIPQKVLLHLKDIPDYKLPDNIKAMSWLPLNDLLGHPKTRAVVYHGGNNGFLETLYHGVPLVIMPLGADQHDVAVRVVTKDLGTYIDKDRLSADYIYQQLVEVLENPKYSATAKRLSAIFRDRPMTAADTSAFWIEHVIKHGGDHLRPPTLDMSFFQIYLVDVAAFIYLVFGILIFLCFRLIRSCCFSKHSTKPKRD